MIIRYMGHACFLLTNHEKRKLIIDPFDPAMGYPVPRGKVDVTAMSHGHHDHNYTDELDSGFARIDSAGQHECAGYRVTALHSFHDEEQGKKRGMNLIFIIEADGLRIAHLGDLGHMPNDEAIAQLKRADVLLLPIGGYYTIDTETATKILRATEPTIAIPMHYKTASHNLPITTEEHFMQINDGRYAHAYEIDITPGNVSEYAGVLALDHPKIGDKKDGV